MVLQQPSNSTSFVMPRISCCNNLTVVGFCADLFTVCVLWNMILSDNVNVYDTVETV